MTSMPVGWHRLVVPGEEGEARRSSLRATTGGGGLRYRGVVDSWLRSIAPGWLHRLPLGQPFLLDIPLAIVLAAVTLAIPMTAQDSDFANEVTRPDSPAAWLLVIGAAWAVPIRRLFPMAALAIGTALQLTVWTIGFPDAFVTMGFLLYSAAAHGRPDRRIWVWLAAVILPLYTGFGVLVADVPAYALPVIGLFAAASVAVGSNIAARQAYAEAAEARALELERSRRADRERALAEERGRIARELHDVVAHGLSVIVVQAAAARRILDRDPDGAATALAQIESTGRNALGEMRQVLSAIRTEPDESWHPTRGLADLDDLVAEFEQTGLAVSVHQSEPEFDEIEPLPATIDVTAYRIVQESLTNVLKHGGDGVAARVEIVREPTVLDLRISDDGRGALAVDGGGHGLQGMQERVEVFGGRFQAGPRLGGGYTVEATLPVDGLRDRAGSDRE